MFNLNYFKLTFFVKYFLTQDLNCLYGVFVMLSLIIGLIGDKMELDHPLYENNIFLEVSEGANIDQSKFLLAQCAQNFDKYLGWTVIRERGVFLDKVEDKGLEFFGWLQNLDWLCCVDEKIKANHTIVVEFYAKALETNIGKEMATMIRGVRVDFRSATIDAIYKLLDMDT